MSLRLLSFCQLKYDTEFQYTMGGGRGGRGNQMTHVCDAYKIKWDGNDFLKRGHTLLTQSSHQAIYKWETVVKEKKRLAKTQISTEG